jgi:hypothetical protein
VYQYYNTTGNTYNNNGSTTTTMDGSNLCPKISYANGIVYTLGYNSTAPVNRLITVNESLNGSVSAFPGFGASASIGGYGGGVVGVTGLGNPVLFFPTITTYSPASLLGWGNSAPTGFSSAYITYPNSSALSLSGYSFGDSGSYALMPSTTPGIGNTIVLVWGNTTQNLMFAIANIIPTSTSVVLTAGTSSSVGIPVSPATSLVTSSVIGGVFAGVAATTATAGSTGQVIVNGAAQLNANYTSTSSGVVDHQGSGVNGVRGTFNGRLINMQGNT